MSQAHGHEPVCAEPAAAATDLLEPRPERTQSRLALGAGLVTVVLWASAFVGIRAAGRELSPGALALGRLTVGSLALALLVAATRRAGLPSRRELPGLLVCGVLWFGLYNLALNEAERRIDAGTAAMLVSVAPVLIAVLAGVILKEGFPRSLLVGCAIAFCGAVLIALATSERGPADWWGALLALAAAVTYAAGVTAQKPLLARMPGLQMTWLACMIGAVVCLPFAPVLADELGRTDGATILWTVYLGVFPTAIAFTTWAYALARTTAGRMGALTYLAPPLAVGLGWTILGETPPALALAGGALCLAGVTAAHAGGKPRWARTRRRPRATLAADCQRSPGG